MAKNLGIQITNTEDIHLVEKNCPLPFLAGKVVVVINGQSKSIPLHSIIVGDRKVDSDDVARDVVIFVVQEIFPNAIFNKRFASLWPRTDNNPKGYYHPEITPLYTKDLES